MAALVSIDVAKEHLRIPITVEDPDLTIKIDQVSAIILAFLARPNDATWTATIAAWTAATVPAVVQLAVLLELADRYMHRGDERRDGNGIGPETEVLLRSTGYRDPVMA